MTQNVLPVIRLVFFLGTFLGLLLIRVSVFAQPLVAGEAHGDHVVVSWVTPQSFSKTQTTQIGVYFQVDPGWHVYWRNPGDSGAAPKFDFYSEQVTVGATQWPVPSRLPIEHLTNLGYPGNVAYLFDVSPTSDADRAEITLNLEWLVCKVDCIPGFGQMVLRRPLSEGPSLWAAEDQKLRDAFAHQVPQSHSAASSDSPWHRAQAHYSSTENLLKLTLPDIAPRVNAVFPLQGGFVNAAEPTRTDAVGAQQFVFSTLPGAQTPDELAVVVSDEHGEHWQINSINLQLAKTIEPRSVTVPSTQFGSAILLIFFAFLGGLILNFMPCVFPVLSIKIMHLCEGNASSVGRFRQGLAYSAGVVTTFMALGAVFLGLRASGAAVGWGFQLQSPGIVLALILLFWVMGLSFLGVVEFGNRLMQWAGAVQSRSSFMIGMLAVFVAAPCTGPFMGAALGASSVVSPFIAFAIFASLGIGLALPFFVLAAVPGLANRLPRPGAWMETLKQFFAFPMFATALWLAWVLSQLLGEYGWWLATSFMLLTGFALWAVRLGQPIIRFGALALSLVAGAWLIFSIPLSQEPKNQQENDRWQRFSQPLVDAKQAQGEAVFIDFTAAWCITCQVNKQLVLSTDEATHLFDRYDVVTMRADWTRYDDNITQALAQFGRNSVPLYVFYPASGDAVEILPQILTLETLRKTFHKHSKHLTFQTGGDQQ